MSEREAKRAARREALFGRAVVSLHSPDLIRPDRRHAPMRDPAGVRTPSFRARPSRPPVPSRPARVTDASRRARPGLAGLGRGVEPRRRDGRSPSRRTGGPAPKRWQRRPRRPPVTARTQRRNRRPRRVVTGARRDATAAPFRAEVGNLRASGRDLHGRSLALLQGDGLSRS